MPAERFSVEKGLLLRGLSELCSNWYTSGLSLVSSSDASTTIVSEARRIGD